MRPRSKLSTRVLRGAPATSASSAASEVTASDLFRAAGDQAMRRRAIAREDRGALEHVLELADVAGPIVDLEVSHRVFVDTFGVDAELRRERVEERIDEKRDVVAPFAKRRNLDREDTSRKRGRAEPIRLHLGRQITVRGGDHAHVDRNWDACRRRARLRAPGAREKLRLRLGWQLTDFVEEDRSALCELRSVRACVAPLR